MPKATLSERGSRAWIAYATMGLGLLGGWAQAAEPPPAATAKASWSGKMQAARRNLAELLVLLSTPGKLETQAGSARALTLTQSIARVAHRVEREVGSSPDPDPSIKVFSRLFADEVQFAADALKQGHVSFARARLAALPGYCIACHTRTQSQETTSAAASWLSDLPAVAQLPEFNRAQYYAASRQFDRALAEYRALLGRSDFAAQQGGLWATAARQALAIAVRVKEDPTLARDLIDQVLSLESAPVSLKSDARVWRLAVQDWLGESSRSRTEPVSPERLASEAERLLATGRARQKMPADSLGYIDYLRASSMAHQLLQYRTLVEGPADAAVRGSLLAEAYSLAGTSYDALRTFKLGELHEIYFEACVRSAPRTEVAARCYQRYEQATFESYEGSSGMLLPAPVRTKLQSLKTLATGKP